MCIICVKPEKNLLDHAQMKVMWDGNPHGAGFMYSEAGEVKIVKGLMSLEALWDAVEEVGPLRKLVMHFRIKTHGAVSPELTHPFWIREGKLGMVHNGVIRPLINLTSDKQSDTAVLARKLSQNYGDPLMAVKNPFHREMLESYIGYSKLVFMDGTGEHWILNEKLGYWHKGCWYSNDKFKAEPKRSTGITYTLPARGEEWWREPRFGGSTTDKPVPTSTGDGLNAANGATDTRSSPVSSPELTKAERRAHRRARRSNTAGGETAKDFLPDQSHWDRIPDDRKGTVD